LREILIHRPVMIPLLLSPDIPLDDYPDATFCQIVAQWFEIIASESQIPEIRCQYVVR
jgi:hypothetical protein